jgi:hypothetical protein
VSPVKCQWVVETCYSLPWKRHVKPCGYEAVVATLFDDGVPRETFCGAHGQMKLAQGIKLFIITPESWYGGAAWKQVGSFRPLTQSELAYRYELKKLEDKLNATS